MSNISRRELGASGERIAREYLKAHHYKILEANFRCPLGEIDIVAQKDEWLVFVEVRTKSSSAFGTPEESLTKAKKDKLVNLALSYLQTHECLSPLWRIDVVAVEMWRDGKVSRVELIENAIS
jgi:putative endonuclease